MHKACEAFKEYGAGMNAGRIMKRRRVVTSLDGDRPIQRRPINMPRLLQPPSVLTSTIFSEQGRSNIRDSIALGGISYASRSENGTRMKTLCIERRFDSRFPRARRNSLTKALNIMINTWRSDNVSTRQYERYSHIDSSCESLPPPGYLL